MPKAPEEKSNVSNEQLENVFKNLEAKEFKVRNETVKMLGNIKNAKARDKLFELIENTALDYRLRLSAIESLGKQEKNTRVMDEFIKICKDPVQDKEIRRACVTFLSNYREPKLIPLFSIALLDPYRFIRVWAIRGLIKIADSRALVALIPALGDEDEEIRKDVQQHLEKESNQILKDLIEAFNNPGSNKFVRYSIAGMLGRINSPDVIKPLINAITDENDRVAMIAIRSLAKLAPEEAIEPLLALAKENEAKVRSVETTLTQIGNEKPQTVIDALTAHLTDESEVVKSVSENVINNLK